jgi:lipoprotein-anchoring transpeptidase ErfK/SrfK
MMINEENAGSGGVDQFAARRLNQKLLDRRSLLLGSAASLGAIALGGCTASGLSDAQLSQMYASIDDDKFKIPAADYKKVDPKYYRQKVRYESKEAPGTIIIDPGNFFVYRIEGKGWATRYGANVGRDGFKWSGEAYVGRKGVWPTWTPPKEMIARQPAAAKYAKGMPGGLDNPLGARVLYLYQNGRYTLYTIYSTIFPDTIGKGITSGCTGLLTQDMMDLYNKTPVKTKVIVLPTKPKTSAA